MSLRTESSTVTNMRPPPFSMPAAPDQEDLARALAAATQGGPGIEDGFEPAPPKEAVALAPVQALTTHPTLKLGSQGAAVVDLQKRLNAHGFNCGAADGVFGAKTDAAVRAFQRANGLTADGIVGPKTWAKLTAATPPPRPGKNPYYSQFVQAAAKAGVPASWANNPALEQLVAHESSWNPAAKNPTSTAFGLFQFLKGTWKTYLPEVPYGTKDPMWQAVGGFRYIKDAYKTPDRAWAFWQATVKKDASLAPADLRNKARTWISHGWAGY